MREYRFNPKLNQRIVDGILQGYKNYIQERIEKDEQMKISSAYAWVRGNHIDDQTATECEELGIEYIKAKAGFTWGYLQFLSRNDRKMFIIKNGRYFVEGDIPNTKRLLSKKHSEQKRDNYLKQLAQINSKVTFPKPLTLFPDERDIPRAMTIFDEHVMNSLETSDIHSLQKEFDQFYMITYEIDQAKMISSIKTFLPNPTDGIAYEVEDLSELIGHSSVDFSDIDTTVLEQDQVHFDYDLPAATEFGIYHLDDITRKRSIDDES